MLGDYSGRAVSSAGDVNGDGFEDVLVGAWGADPNGIWSGSTYVVFGRSGGFNSVINFSTLDGTTGFRLDGVAESDQAGYAVSSAGDVNGDGFDDLIVGAQFADPNGHSSGSSYVLFGRSGAFASAIDLSTLDGTTGFRLDGVAASDNAGSSVSSGGDVNGDGFDDLIVGANGAKANGNSHAGSSYVLFGRSGGFASVINLSTIDGTTGFRLDGAATADISGESVSGAGDVNGDGFDDLIVGARFADPNGDSSGSSYVFFGRSGGFASAINLSTLDGTTGFRLDGAAAGDQSGYSVSGAGDVNGDGFDDLIIGAFRAAPNGNTSAGSSYVVFGKSGGFASAISLSSLNGTDGFRLDGVVANDESGNSVSGSGDVNGDGFDDLIVGAHRADPNGSSNAGSSFVLFGRSGGFASVINLGTLDGTTGFRLDGAVPVDLSGSSVSGAGDVNGDGFDDLIIGARLADPVFGSEGSSYVVFGGNFTGGVETQVGGDGPQTLNATLGAGVDILIGGRGDDTLISDGGDDVLRGGEGDDVLAIPDTNVSPRRLQGGTGTDTLRLDGAGLTLDLTAIADNRITGVEAIDLGGGGNRLIVTQQEVRRLSGSSNTLTVRGSSGDVVVVQGTGWSPQGIVNIDGTDFEQYTDDVATLNIESGIEVINPVIGLGLLDGTTGFRLDGAESDDQSGRSVSSAGDVNGDGFDDVIIGAYWADPNGSRSGSSYVVFGRSGGFASAVNLSSLDGTTGFRLDGALAGDVSGYSVSGAGDVNGDSFDDLIVGAFQADPNGDSSGSSYVLFGKSSGFASVINLSTLDGTTGFRLDGIAASDFSGYSVSGAGDVNGDGFDDLIMSAVGVHLDPPFIFNSGSSYVVFGRSGGFASVINLSTLDGTIGFRLDGVGDGDRSGRSVSGAGDVNGDGFDDLLISAEAADPNGNSSGSTYVLFGKSGGFASAINLSTLDGTTGFRLDGVAANDYSGRSVSGAGDVNGDGFDDLIVGAFFADPNALDVSGSSYVLFGNSGGFASVINLSTLDGTTGFRLDGAATADESGSSVSGAGDVNGDGFDDLLVGARRADPNGSASGSGYVFFGKSGGFASVVNLSTLDGSTGFRLDGVAGLDFTGDSVSGAGDVNGDGFDDLIIGARFANPNGVFDAGSSYVVFGGNFTGGAETQVGGDGPQTLTATLGAGVDILIGGRGDDTLISDGGDDVLRGGEGDDVLAIPDTNFSPRRLQGGTGTDTLRLDGAGLTLDLTAIADDRITGIEVVDIRGTGANVLLLNSIEVLNLSAESNTLIVLNDIDDAFNFGGGWTQQADEMIDGESFFVFTQGTATLKVQTPAPFQVTLSTTNGAASNSSGIGMLAMTFNVPAVVQSVNSLTVFNHTTVMPVDVSSATLLDNGTPIVSWDFSSLNLPDGRYTAEVATDQVTTTVGGLLASTHLIEFHVMRGDVSGDGRVNATDFVVVDANFDPLPGTPFRAGDANGDGRVNASDFVEVDANFDPLLLTPLTYDFGDAPEAGTSFPTTLSNDGARHVSTGNTLILGAGRDAEPDGQSTAAADGDGPDDDGLSFAPMIRGTNVALTVTSSGAGFVNGWIDFNQDGNWDDPGEQVFTDEPVVSGINNQPISVPAGATLGSTFARFRLTGSGGYSYFGLAPNGEVEDYQLSIVEPAPDVPAETAEVNPTTGKPTRLSTLLNRLFAIPVPAFTTFEHPLSLFSTGQRSRLFRR